jgi:7,8-dihydro-6-hydroxymethylpterin-pyrophosphokinase
MAAKSKKETAGGGSIRPAKLPQVNKFLEQHGIANVRLERGHGYFTLWGVPIDDWLNRVVVVDRLDALTLDQWLEKYRQLEEQNRRANPFAEKPKQKKK